MIAEHDRAAAEPLPGPAPSVRQARGPAVVVAGLTGVALAIGLTRALAPAYPGGDLLYHSALAFGLLRGGLPLEGAYAGLPAYYPPGFHLLLGALLRTLGLTPLGAAGLLYLVFLPVLAIGTYLLASRLTGRPWVAVLAVALTLFAGAYNLNPIRQWVNSLFMGGQAAWTAYPRDIVFATLPFAALAFVRALEPGVPRARRIGWSLVSGSLLGAAALTQVQLLLPIPVAFAATALVVAVRDRGRRMTAVGLLLLAGVIAAVIVLPWLLGTVDDIRRNAGVALDSADQLEPARFGFWAYPREFGLLLPLGMLGAGATLLFLRRADGPRPGGAPGPWRPSLREGGVLLATWWALPFVVGVLYNPAWPLEDALRPQRMWLIGSQPLAILGAVGLVVAAEHVLRRSHPRLVGPVVIATAVVMAVPATAATTALVAGTWTQDRFVMVDREADRVPNFASLLGIDGPTSTVLAPEDWSALTWFETGDQVVGLVPPGYAKLAFDPQRFTQASQDERRIAQAEAWSGDMERLIAVADRFAAAKIVIPRDGDRWALLDVAAAGLVLADPAAAQGAVVLEGNGWDAVSLTRGQRLVLPAGISGPVTLRVRVLAQGDRTEPVTLRVLAEPAAGGLARELSTLVIDEGDDEGDDEWARGSVGVNLPFGDRLVLEAVTPATIQAVTGWVEREPPPTNWRLVSETDEASVLERVP